MSWYSASGRCVDSGNDRIHAHLLGGNWVDHGDLAPSAVLCVVFFLAIAGVGYRWWQFRASTLFTFKIAFLFTGLAFAVRAAIANTAPSNVPRSAIITEQCFFVLGQLLLLLGAILYTRTFLYRATFVHWPSTFLYLSIAILVTSLILACVAFSRAPTPPTSYFPSLQYSQMRIAAATLPFILVCLTLILWPFAKLVAPELPGLGLGLLSLTALFLWVPAFYSFCVATLTDDTSPLVCSSLFFYLAFGLFQLLAVVPLLALSIHHFGFGYALGDLVGGMAPIPIATAVADGQAERLHRAMEEAAIARVRQEEEARLLEEAERAVEHNAAAAGLGRPHHGGGWDLHLV
ncbi:hypothetical protein JCM8097_003367 [Rhodosporidiobolus ruineniae]